MRICNIRQLLFNERKVKILYSESDMVKIAKRENNNKRKYLVVNPLQGKHVPVVPSKAFRLFHQLTTKLKQYDKESTLVIGFSETATAIGAYVAIELEMSYIQTTREYLLNANYLFFTESHSHATEQKLVIDDIEQAILQGKFKQIIFVEDEVTTGNTILNLIAAMERKWSDKLQYSIASLLNGMCEEVIAKFKYRGIQLHYLVKTNHENYTEVVDAWRGDGIYHSVDCKHSLVKDLHVYCSADSRRLLTGVAYQTWCRSLWKCLKRRVLPCSTLVLGTEEFMYPALYVANKIENLSEASVVCHSTSRSPIVVSSEEEYPLHQRWELVSLYEEQRKTFVYDLEKYGQVFIITDADNLVADGIYSLVNALVSCGNENITLVRWCKY